MLFHELGHCDLNRKHDDGLRDAVDARQPYFSFMSSYLLEALNFPEVFDTIRNQQCSQKTIEKYIERGGFLSMLSMITCNANLELYYYEYVLNSDLDRAFEEMYRELFSIQGTAEAIRVESSTAILNRRCFASYDYQLLKPEHIPVLKHLTIGPTVMPNFESFHNNMRIHRRRLSHSVDCKLL